MHTPRAEYLDAFGPLRHTLPIAIGDRVTCWAGTGNVELIHKPFNGVQGIHAYASVRLDDGGTCAAMLDRLTPAGELAMTVDGWLW